MASILPTVSNPYELVASYQTLKEKARDALVASSYFVSDSVDWCRLLKLQLPEYSYFVRAKGENLFVVETKEKQVEFCINGEGKFVTDPACRFLDLQKLVTDNIGFSFIPLTVDEKVSIEESFQKTAFLDKMRDDVMQKLYSDIFSNLEKKFTPERADKIARQNPKAIVFRPASSGSDVTLVYSHGKICKLRFGWRNGYLQPLKPEKNTFILDETKITLDQLLVGSKRLVYTVSDER